MKFTAQEIYDTIRDFRDLQQNKFYDLPLDVMLILQKNYAAVNAVYTIVRQTEQIILDRNNYENYEDDIAALMAEEFDIDVELYDAFTLERSRVSIPTSKTVMRFAKGGQLCN